MFENEIEYIRSCFPGQDLIPLHEPCMGQWEKQLLNQAIDSGYVSSVGAFVDQFEKMLCEYTGSAHAIAVVNGTAALHAALMVAGVKPGEMVLTQPLTFVATANAIGYCGADPVFLDVDEDTMGLSPDALENFLGADTCQKEGELIHKKTGKRIAACLPVHIFGLPCRIDRILEICDQYGLPVVEDSAEAMGTRYRGRHAGRFGKMGVFSFNGNKIITAGGGGAIITDDKEMAATAKHLTTTARCKDPYAFYHDAVGFNYRMPNLNAAFACAQMEQLDGFIENKRRLARDYEVYFSGSSIRFMGEPKEAKSNFWLNCVRVETREIRDQFILELSEAKIMVRPVWRLLNRLPMYETCHTGNLETAISLADTIISLPSSVRPCP